jgi:stage II sporulation protein M
VVRDYFPEAQPTEPKIPLVKRIAAFYVRQFQFIKRMRRYLRYSIYIFLLTTAAGTVFFLLKPDLAVHWMADFKANYLRRHPTIMSQAGIFFYIAIHNLTMSLQVCLLGLVPFFIPAVFGLVLNATLLCLIFVAGLIQNEPIVMRFLTLVLPHGIIEIPTMIFVAGFALYLSSQMTKRLFRKKPQSASRSEGLFGFISQDELPDWQEAFVDILYMFAAVIIPLVLFAALIETFITPLVYRLFA